MIYFFNFILNLNFFFISFVLLNNANGFEPFNETIYNLKENFKNSLKTYMKISKNILEISINDTSRFEQLNKFLFTKAYQNNEKINLMAIPDFRYKKFY